MRRAKLRYPDHASRLFRPLSALAFALLVLAGDRPLPLPAARAAAIIAQDVAPPLGLTASDGTGLELVSYAVRAQVEDPLAFTELRLIFRNPQDRVLEGRFRIALPSSAAISRFAMKIGGAWQEGEVVERQAARVAYEDFLHRRQDPALLENEGGNEFAARIFPIPARGEKELIVSYSQELVRRQDPYRLPLIGLPAIAHVDIRVLVARRGQAAGPASSLGGAVVEQQVVEVQKRNWRPDTDLVVAQRGADARLGLRHGDQLVARVTPLSGGSGSDPIGALVVLFDSSASRALGFATEIERLGAVLEALRARGNFELQVLAFDQEIRPLFRGKASGWPSAASQLLARRAEGASDLGHALTRLAALGRSHALIKAERLLIVGDGVVTAGNLEGDTLRARTKALAAVGIKRLDVLASGGIRDDARLAALATAGLPRAGIVLRTETSAAEAAARLGLAARSGLKVEVPGARWSWPTTIDGVQPGDDVLVYADLPAGQPLRIAVDGVTVAAEAKGSDLVAAEGPLLERAWVKARLARLAHQRDTLAAGDTDLRAALQQQMIALSTRFRVLCDYTALLVLESEADYARFNIDRRALTDILTVGLNGLEVLARRAAALPPARAERAKGGERAAERDQRDDLSTNAAPPPRGQAAPQVDNAPPGDQRREGSDGNRQQAVVGATAQGAARPAPAARLLEREVAAPAASPARSAPRPTPSLGARDEDSSASESVAAGSRRANTVLAPTSSARRARGTVVAIAAKKDQGPPALTGELAEIVRLIAARQRDVALRRALAWRQREPGELLAIVALARALTASGRREEAARVLGSIIDLFPSRADLRRFVAGELEALGTREALELATDSLQKALADRPDHPSSHHLYAMALLKRGHAKKAFEVIEQALGVRFPAGRFAGSDVILREDLGLAAAAWTRQRPTEASAIRDRLQRNTGRLEAAPSLRFVLTWETDANDVDFHIRDARGGHAYYGQRRLTSGGELYADVTTGYGPECFTIRGAAPAFPYRLSAHYYSRGPMGYGMGRLEVISHDGQGKLRFDTRPFVVMNDHAYVDLGRVASGATAAPTTAVVH
ncbi:MAG: hypothetical protein IPL40_04245 [Proteobacteria bacterium]|nr:hypothetical protein [Pseudomonadota bacterium]